MQIIPVLQCALCRKFCRRALCEDCRRDIVRLAADSRCPRCAAIAVGTCGACLSRPPAFDKTHAALSYLPPLSALIRDFKFHGRWQITRLLAEFARAPSADMMLPVPLFFTRERWRGFNQARELARAVPPPTPPLCDNHLLRIVDTSPQSLLPDAAARQKNVRGAFVAANVRDKTVLVVDDVMSSGATLNEIAVALKRAGAAAVINLVIARAARNKAA